MKRENIHQALQLEKRIKTLEEKLEGLEDLENHTNAGAVEIKNHLGHGIHYSHPHENVFAKAYVEQVTDQIKTMINKLLKEIEAL